MRQGLVALTLVSCLQPQPNREQVDVQRLPPTIDEAALDCDIDGGTWSLTLTTAGWAGAVTTYWTLDGDYVERHRIASTAYAARRGLRNV